MLKYLYTAHFGFVMGLIVLVYSVELGVAESFHDSR